MSDAVGKITQLAPAVLGALEVRESCIADARQLHEIARALRLAGLRHEPAVVEDVKALIRERRLLRWRLAEVQKLLDDGFDAGDRRVLRVSRQVMHFILTGKLPNGQD